MIISWNTTQVCNIHCQHCYRNAGTETAVGELNTEEGRRLIDQVAEAGFKIMIFSGGEPLMRPDLPMLIRHAAAAGLRPVLGTNGTLLDEAMVGRLLDAGLAAAGISLDSIQPELHNHFRQSPGAWQRTVQGIEVCHRLGLPFQIHTTVMDWNLPEITRLTDFAVTKGAVAHHIFFLVPTGRGAGLNASALTAPQFENLLDALLEKSRTAPIEIKPTCAPQFMRIAAQKNLRMRYGRGCLAATAYCVILPNGNVQPCPYLPVLAGNVRQASFVEIWRDSPVFAELRSAVFTGKCGQCEYKGICGGCRARAYFSTDDYLGSDSSCIYPSQASPA